MEGQKWGGGEEGGQEKAREGERQGFRRSKTEVSPSSSSSSYVRTA